MRQFNSYYKYPRKKKEKLDPTCHLEEFKTGENMVVYDFVFPDGNEGILFGLYRGWGAISGDEKYYTDRIGVYTINGDYYNIEVDLRSKNRSSTPTYKIDGVEFFHPILRFFTMGCKVNPENGYLLPPDGAKK
jgi:hypothetical protein